MKNIVPIISMCLLLSGCGAKIMYDKMVNSDDMQKSKAAYKACLAQRGEKGCTAEKAAFDADVAAYNRNGFIVEHVDKK